MFKKLAVAIAMTVIVFVVLILGHTLMPSVWVNAQHRTIQPIVMPMQSDRLIVHLRHSLDDPRATYMALNTANTLQQKGANVALLLTIEGARIADARLPLNVRWRGEKTFEEMYDQFVASGGRVFVGPVCAQVAGITENFLRKGTQLAQGNIDIPSLLMTGSNVIDF